MRLILSTLVFSNLLLAGVAQAEEVKSISIIVSDTFQGNLDAKLELQKGFFAKTVEELELKNLSKGPNQIVLKKAQDIKAIKLNLNFNSRNNLPDGHSETALISGTLTPGKEFKKDSLSIIDEDLKADISCSNIVSSSISGSELRIDLSRFSNLSDCGGKDSSHWSYKQIGKRNIGDGPNWFTLEDDVRMGKQNSDQFIKENGNKILPDTHPTTVYLQEKMEIIAKNSDMPNLKPKVRVINADVLNAFALPGGYVFVFRGLMEKSPSEAALLGVLGHEWAHVTARHGTRGMTRTLKTMIAAVTIALATQVWAEVTDDKVKDLVLPLIGAGTLLGAQLRLLSKGREQEMEADRLGSQYALLSKYHPRGIGDMFETFKRETGGSSTTLEEILSSHPDHDTRIGRSQVLSALFYPSRSDFVITSQGYDRALAELTREPMPPTNESVQVAKSFVNGIQKQQEDIIMDYMKGYISQVMKSKIK